MKDSPFLSDVNESVMHLLENELKSQPVTLQPPACAIPKLDICCALLLLPLANGFEAPHMAALSFKQRPCGVKESSDIFLMVLCAHAYTPQTHIHIILTLPENLGTLL